ncbi:MAG: hypothetical protein JKX68_09665 [Flavobacteriales bacterium]|nr:hypothetical protein [Flavobacteriales bacterium]
MKTIILTLAIFSTSLFNYSYANGNNSMDKVLENSISFKNGELTINKDQNEFVRVSFKINEEGQIEILKMNYSNEKIKDQLIKKLTTITPFGSFDIEKVYNYNFTFKKI